MNIRENVAISSLTTMRLGGPARYLIEIEKLDDLPQAYRFAREKNLPVYVLGGGSNIIGRDEGFSGVILHCALKGMKYCDEPAKIATEFNTELAADETLLESFAGEELDNFVRFACKEELSGIELLSAIPGTVGAAPVQNVGAYGGEISQCLVAVDVYDSKEDKFVSFAAKDLDLSYRHSIFNHGDQVGRYFITRIIVKLKHGKLNEPFYRSLQSYLDEHNIHDYSPESIRLAVRAVRDSKLPPVEKYASSGSFFKNIYLNEEDAKKAEAKGIPVWEGGKVPSGWLIDHAGLKGKVFHGMRVWDFAALVLVNESANSYAELAQARQEISDIIFDQFEVRLEQEPMEIGDER